jgi:hypothetical protein
MPLDVKVPLDEAYFVWLYSQVGSVKLRNKAKSYWKLLRLLYTKEFVWSIEKDGNRAVDGIDLRQRFASDANREIDDECWLGQPCSVLEMLIALSFRLAWESVDLGLDDWFWKLLDNLALTGCTDADPPTPEMIDRVIDKVVNREYAANGAGGLFPLKHTQEDQREVELWYQAQTYLLENGSI